MEEYPPLTLACQMALLRSTIQDPSNNSLGENLEDNPYSIVPDQERLRRYTGLAEKLNQTDYKQNAHSRRITAHDICLYIYVFSAKYSTRVVSGNVRRSFITISAKAFHSQI